MSGEPKMFRINPENRESEAIDEVNFADLGLRERYDIQEWIAANPGILGDDLLIVGKEFSDFDRTSERLDLLAVDADGKLVIIELKRDDTGADVHWQAIKYASYLRKASAEEITRILANHAKVSEDDAEQQLREHLDSGDLSVLNHDQRIIIASHRFAPEVTSAVLWLNEKAPGENLISCIQLTPYQDAITSTLYLQTNTIIPVPGAEQYAIQIASQGDGGEVRRVGPSLRRTSLQDSDDTITLFARKVEELATEGLADELKPDRSSRQARIINGPNRYYCMWYARHPFNLRPLQYVLHVYPTHDPVRVVVNLEHRKRYLRDRLRYSESEIEVLSEILRDLKTPDGTEIQDTKTWLRPQVTLTGNALDDEFAGRVADILRQFIEVGTPAFEDFESERSGADTSNQT